MAIFEETAKPIINAALGGYNGTIFAYGQTGTGKTYTMEGVYDDVELRGIIPNAFHHIFHHIDDDSDGANRQYLVTASYLEIYNEEIRDLLSKTYKQKLSIKEHPDKGIYVKDLSAFVVKDVAEINKVMGAGKKNRSVGATKMNVDSSRSHSVFTITIECSTTTPDGNQHIHVGKLNLVDLAGSERQSKTEAEGARFAEAIKINMSLSALGNVISALSEGATKGKRHIPYRDSQLTRLLQDSLGGNSKTVMVAAIGPADYNYDETISTLRWASRAKNIKNKPVINEDPKDAMLRQFQEEIERLKAQLAAVAGGEPLPPGAAGASGAAAGAPGSEKFAGMDEAAIAEMEARIAEERARMEADTSLAQEEKDKLAKKLAKRESEIAAERASRDALAAQIAALEEKVIVGGTNLLDEVEKQELELKQAELEMERKRKEAARLQAMVEEKEEETMMEAQKFHSLQEEVDVKTQKLKRLWAKFQAARAEITDLQEEHASDRESLVSEIRRQNNELKLCKLIVSYFIPDEYLEYVRDACTFDSDANDYVVYAQAETGNNIERAAMLNGGFAPGPPPSAAVDGALTSPASPGTRFEPDKLQAYEDALNESTLAPGDYNTGAENEAPTDVFEAVPNVYLSYSPERGAIPSSYADSRLDPASKPNQPKPKDKGKGKGKGKDKGKGKAKDKGKGKGKGKDKGKGKEVVGDEELYPESRGFVVRS